VQPVAAIDSRKAVEATLEAWRIAWEARDVSAYLSHYAASFQPADQLSREQWQTQRRRRLQAAERINLEFTDQHFQVECDQAEVHFTQHYRANNHTDVVRKTLHLTRIGNTWQIVSEQQQAQR
jgi:ketosteroid isomerase-like protein